MGAAAILSCIVTLGLVFITHTVSPVAANDHIVYLHSCCQLLHYLTQALLLSRTVAQDELFTKFYAVVVLPLIASALKMVREVQS